MAVNKVVTSDGTTIIDLSEDTVTSSDHIMNGYTGHLADGTIVNGTGSGVEYEWELIYSTDSARIISEDPNYIAVTYENSLTEGEVFRITWNGEQSILTTREITYQGQSYIVMGNPGILDQSIDDGSGLTYYAHKYSSTILLFGTSDEAGYIPLIVERRRAVTATLISKTITENGTYNASSDDADGYSEVVVNVSGGSSTLQSKSISYTPSSSSQSNTITPDSGYDGLSSVSITVNEIPSEYIIPSGSITLESNGTFDVSEYANAIINISSSGSDGLEYEEGVWTPSSDIARGTISFTNTHSKAPVVIVLADATNTTHSTTYSNYTFMYIDIFKLWNTGIPYSSSNMRYAHIYYNYRGSSTSSTSISSAILPYDSDNTDGSSRNYPRYWATEDTFYPYTNSTSRYWRSNRTYKWIAIWK